MRRPVRHGRRTRPKVAVPPSTLIPAHDGLAGIGLARRLAEAARVHLERGAGLDEGLEQRLVQLRRGGEVGRRHVRDRGSASRSRGGRSCRTARTGSRRGPRRSTARRSRPAAGRRPTPRPATRGTASRRRRGRCRSRSRRRGAGDGRGSPPRARESYVISTPNRIATPCGRPALGGLADGPLADLERDEVVGRRAGLEVDVVGDADLGDPALDAPARRRRRSGRGCPGERFVWRWLSSGRSRAWTVGSELSPGSLTRRSGRARGRPARTPRAPGRAGRRRGRP